MKQTLNLEREDVATAVEYLEQACEANKDQADLAFALASAHKELGNLQGSEKYLKKAITLEPDRFEFIYNYGLLLQEAERPDDAIIAFEKAVQLQSNNHELLSDIGVLYHFRKDYEKAIGFFNRAIEAKPDYVVASINLAYVYIAKSEFISAQRIVDQLNMANHQNAEAVKAEVNRFFKREEGGGI